MCEDIVGLMYTRGPCEKNKAEDTSCLSWEDHFSLVPLILFLRREQLASLRIRRRLC